MDQKKDQLKKILEKIELQKKQRDRAIELYTNVCNAIEEKSGLTITFYPQGSFATKTAIRPYKNGREQSYDVDVICEVSIKKEDITPKILKERFRTALKNSRYSEIFTEWDKCFTIEFKEQDGVNFSIDIIPSVSEDSKTLESLNIITEYPLLVKSSIAIPSTFNSNNTWLTNNPKGYVAWFENEIQQFHSNYLLKRHNISNTDSIEDLPESELNNSLLTIIKILKRARDVFYYRRNTENKPSSIIITTIIGKLAKNLNPTSNELDLLVQVIEQLRQLKNYPVNMQATNMNKTGYAISDIISRDMGTWVLNNPTNGNDNLLNSWNEDKDKANDFFNWVENLGNTFVPLLTQSVEDENITEVYNALALTLPKAVTEKALFSVTPSSVKPWKTK
ncbi:nucleotidyltransferase [Listeria monocytogenes]